MNLTFCNVTGAHVKRPNGLWSRLRYIKLQNKNGLTEPLGKDLLTFLNCESASAAAIKQFFATREISSKKLHLICAVVTWKKEMGERRER